ncbi:MAG: phosphonate C-P lyase system protein PhnG [Roseiflexaceae bacterium]|nr:phosphonate C-P lyase system protein PhnG [Roseiflexaceae bacterium]
MDQSTILSILSRTQPQEVKLFAEDLIPDLGPIEVVRNRTGLVMLPAIEPVKGAAFYLGEALIAEAYIRLAETEGYAACLGRDLEQALAIGLIDAARAGSIATQKINDFVTRQAALQATADQQLRVAVEATRVEMETF